jgi:translocation and assembly module TamA
LLARVSPLIALASPFCLAITVPTLGLANEISFEGEAPDDKLARDITKAARLGERFNSLFEARRHGEGVRREIADLLNSAAYFDPDIRLTIEGEDRPFARFAVDPGSRYAVGRVRIDYVAGQPSPQARLAVLEELEVSAGDLALPARIIAQEQTIVQTLRQSGHAFAELGERDVIADRTQAEISVRYRAVPGPEVVMSQVVFEGGAPMRAQYLKRLIPFETPTLYSLDKRAALERRLDGLPSLNGANLRVTEGEDGQFLMVAELEPRAPYLAEAGLQWASDLGPGGTVELTRRNLTGRADDLHNRFTLSEREQSLNSTWQRPHAFAYQDGFEVEARLAGEETDAFDLAVAGISAERRIATDKAYEFRLGIRVQAVSEDRTFPEPETRDYVQLAARGAVQVDRSDDLLNPTRGWRGELDTRPVANAGSDSSQYLLSTAQIRGYLPLGEEAKLVLAGRAKAGFVLGAPTEAVPLADRFYAGGGGSVRGYEFQGIGPVSPDGRPIGGRQIAELSVEARYQLSNRIGVVAFVDGAQVKRQSPVTGDGWRGGAGLGVRHDTPIGPLRLDVAAPLDRRSGDEPFQIYLSIGQAF